MKTIWKILFILFGLIVFLAGCAMGGTVAFIVQLFGAGIMMVGLFPLLDKWTTKKDKTPKVPQE